MTKCVMVIYFLKTYKRRRADGYDRYIYTINFTDNIDPFFKLYIKFI